MLLRDVLPSGEECVYGCFSVMCCHLVKSVFVDGAS